MGDYSGIQWTDATWNPTVGCDRVSPGCANCYAVPQAKRNQAMARALDRHVDPADPYMRDGDPRTSGPGFGLQMHRSRLYLPLGWARPRRIFVDSMSDLFHPEVSDGFLARVWDVMGRSRWHTFQILTKRPERMREWVGRWADTTGDGAVDFSRDRGPDAVRARYSSGRAQLFAAMLDDMGEPPEGSAYPLYDWMEGQCYWPRVLPNVWLGTSVENARWRSRIDDLRETPAAVRFLSCEPLLGPLVCPTCRGAGWDVEVTTEAGCCGNPYPGGECRAHCVIQEQVPTQVQCPGPDGKGCIGDLDLEGIGWVIAGGESGPGARPLREDWIRDIVGVSCDQGASPFVKQLGSVWAREHGARDRKGGDIDEWPADLRVREFPT